ncbi:transcriptional regulator, LysR family [Arboricoccus pini]|uniref:Transcriptional regulator, LysR family n=1 Tax=Arboricoccus pini TaxID=1963835 RepID=A0A212RQ12_9PROT|nr:LysR substrate-binding domain-containing protein [Arboricoccus pini]SNB74546.1 transcriptional regulator, LysR family [Arboricoccus pini]
MIPEIRHLRAFAAVAEELHFGRAAVRLNIVQPALSMQIRQLEEMLGVRLLDRTRRSVAVTEPGQLFLEEARRILRALDQAIDLAQRAGRGEAGRLAIGYSAATAYSGLLSRLLSAFHAALPEITLDVRELHPAMQREALLTRELDIGFVVANAESRKPAFDSLVVERWRMALALPTGHPLAKRAVVPFDLLREEPFITYEALGEDLGVDAFREAAGFAPMVRHHAQSPIMLLSLVGAGLGIATVPTILQSAAPPGVTFLQGDRAFPELPIAALFRRHNGNAALRRFVEGLEAV